MNEIAEKPDILSLLPEELEAKLTALGQPRFRAAQIFQWLGRGVRDFDEMTNLSKDLREKLKAKAGNKMNEGMIAPYVKALEK